MKEIIFLSVICFLITLTGADERNIEAERIQVQSRASGSVIKDASIPQKYKSHKIKENVNKPTEPPQQMLDMDKMQQTQQMQQMQQMQEMQQMQQMQKIQQNPPKVEPVDDVDDEDEVDDDDDEDDDDLIKPEQNKEQVLEKVEESTVSDRNRLGDMSPTSNVSPMSDVNPMSDETPMTDMSDSSDTSDMSDDMSQDFLAAGDNFQNMAALTPANPNLIYSSGINAKHIIGYIPIRTSNGQALIFPAGAVRIVQPEEAVDLEDDFVERAVQRQNNAKKRNKRKKNQRRRNSYQVYRRPENYYWQRRWPMASYGRRPTNSNGKRYGNGNRRNMYRNFYDY